MSIIRLSPDPSPVFPVITCLLPNGIPVTRNGSPAMDVAPYRDTPGPCR